MVPFASATDGKCRIVVSASKDFFWAARIFRARATHALRMRCSGWPTSLRGAPSPSWLATGPRGAPSLSCPCSCRARAVLVPCPSWHHALRAHCPCQACPMATPAQAKGADPCGLLRLGQMLHAALHAVLSAYPIRGITLGHCRAPHGEAANGKETGVGICASIPAPWPRQRAE